MFSQTVIHKTREIRSRIPLVKFVSEEILRKNLHFAAQTMRASEGLLQCGRGFLGALPEPSAFELALYRYFTEHEEEEAGHYDWIMDDLAEISHPNWLAAELAGAQYYMVKHVHPAALLGYMAVLEGDPPRIEDVAVLEARFGERLLRCMRFHAEHDLDHRIALFKIIDMTPARLQPLVLQSVEHTLTLLHIAQKSWEV